MTNSIQVKSPDLGILVIRIAMSIIVLFHGISKMVHGVGWIEQMLGSYSLPGFIAYGTYVAEIIAPVLIILGLFTRLAALTVIFDMTVAIITVLSQQIFAVKEMGGGWGIELEMLILSAALALFFTGAGKFSLNKGQKIWD